MFRAVNQWLHNVAYDVASSTCSHLATLPSLDSRLHGTIMHRSIASIWHAILEAGLELQLSLSWDQSTSGQTGLEKTS